MGSLPRPVRALVAIGCVLVAGQILHVAGVLGAATLWEGWAPCIVSLAGGLTLLIGARMARQGQLRWTILAVGLCWWAVASLLWWLVFDRSDEASAMFLPIYPC